jgi:hypothetical protein
MARKIQVSRADKKNPQTDSLKPVFLQTYADSGFILQTCERVGIPRNTFSRWLEQDQKFASDFAIANEKVTEKYELAAGLRAVNGYDEPVFHQGKQVGTIKRYSDRLLELLLKSRNREKYAERINYNIDEESIAGAIASRFVSIVRRVAPDTCPACKTRLDLSTKIAEELLNLSSKVEVKTPS